MSEHRIGSQPSLTQPGSTLKVHGARGGISRRGFLVGSLAAAGVLACGLPEQVPVLGVQKALAATDIGNALDDYIVRIRPKGFFRVAGVHSDGIAIGDACWLWKISCSSKLLLTWESKHSGYMIRATSNFEENKQASNSVWAVDKDSKEAGKTIHVWGQDFDDKDSRAFRFEKLDNGCYYIKNVKSGLYVSLDNTSSDSDKNEIKQQKESFEWELQVVGKRLGKYDEYPESIICAQYDTYSMGVNWMSRLSDDTLLSNISIPGTHDTATCSVSGDSGPTLSMYKCQQDYIPTQLHEGIRYLDLRLGGEEDPVLNHGGTSTFNKANTDLTFSTVIGYINKFLTEQPTETVIALISNHNGDDTAITNAMAAQIEHYKKEENGGKDLFYCSSRIPTLGEVRGKIVVLRRFTPAGDKKDTYKYGIDLVNWDDIIDQNDTKGLYKIFESSGTESSSCIDPTVAEGTQTQRFFTTVYAQDAYQNKPSKKISWVDAALEDTADWKWPLGSTDVDGQTVSEGRWTINYTSSSRFITFESNPYSAAQTMNEHLYESSYINRVLDDKGTYDDCKKYLGILVSDFTDASLAHSVYRRNYEDPSTGSGIYYLPRKVTLTYGDDFSQAQFEGGKTSGAGYFKLVDEDAVLDVAASGSTFAVAYIHVDALGNEYPTELAADIPFVINPRALTIDWSTLKGLATGTDVAELMKDKIKRVLKGDSVHAAFTFYADNNGAPGSELADTASQPAGTYWIEPKNLKGKQAANYVFKNTEPVQFELKDASELGSGEGVLPKTGDRGVMAAIAGVAAVAGAAAAVGVKAAHAPEEQ